jgi:hypothetical protein
MLTQKGGFSKEIMGGKDDKTYQLYQLLKKVKPAVSRGFIHKEDVSMVAGEWKREWIASNNAKFIVI